jgi:hypothetical protein
LPEYYLFNLMNLLLKSRFFIMLSTRFEDSYDLGPEEPGRRSHWIVIMGPI